MGYNTELAQRVRFELLGESGMDEKKMFGGVGFMISGNIVFGVNKDNLIVRVGLERYAELMEKSHTKVFDMTGKPMKGWLVVTPKGDETKEDLKNWVRRGVEFARSLPPK